ncbi:hypothetical protein QBC38DRAFT_82453 [Podospora fimiseda]|uniref:Uncharacterized protein n=1 Tax=Podospora fimiseda TaxID=252190 RepID=A0AAN6YR66_9PEZI|nr:hypothetical protein QBC38DRAFT_82453 [Podospora fimiseda]
MSPPSLFLSFLFIIILSTIQKQNKKTHTRKKTQSSSSKHQRSKKQISAISISPPLLLASHTMLFVYPSAPPSPFAFASKTPKLHSHHPTYPPTHLDFPHLGTAVAESQINRCGQVHIPLSPSVCPPARQQKEQKQKPYPVVYGRLCLHAENEPTKQDKRRGFLSVGPCMRSKHGCPPGATPTSLMASRRKKEENVSCRVMKNLHPSLPNS